MSQLRKFEIKPENGAIAIRIVNATTPNAWEYYRFTAIKSIVPVSVLGMGTRQFDNNRKNPLRHDDKLEFVISFHDENESSPIRYHIEDVANQPTWTNDMPGLIVALADMNSWMNVASGGGGGGTSALTPAESAALLSLSAQKTPTSIVTIANHTVPIGATEVSIFNNGATAATVNGTTLPPGITRTFGFRNPIASAIVCTSAGNQLLIDYMV